MLYFTSDQHFCSQRACDMHMRPFKDYNTFERTMINNINSLVTEKDTLLVLGDWVNYNKYTNSDWNRALSLVSKINCSCKLIIGNNESRLISDKFSDDVQAFTDCCEDFGWDEVCYNKYITINKNVVYLTHNPIDADSTVVNLFGHLHRVSLLNNYGLNVGCDVHYYMPISEDTVIKHFKRMKDYCIRESGHLKSFCSPVNYHLWNKVIT